MRIRNELLAISVDGKWKYPVFQFQGNVIIPGINRIIKILCSRDGMFWDACLFLLNKHDALVMDDGTCITPIEGIKSGKNIDLIASLAYGRFDQTAN
ncbi:hypothetical protein C8D91_2962 [Marinicella litoralis]|uniref:Uncharacterized protein n=1 Tax=Marinicella litoralis TaxID=644220 RepID=A0A4R6X8I1_9GAMM|nr:hypothetical protein C8D91_2962 [Marinicella litoralis]